MPQLMIDDKPVFILEYPYSPTDSHNRRQRKKLGLFEFGNTCVRFTLPYTEDMLTKVGDWWQREYAKLEEDFNVEVVEDGESIWLNSFDVTPCFKHIESKCQVFLDNTRANVLGHYNMLPEAIRDAVVSIKVGDWDYV